MARVKLDSLFVSASILALGLSSVAHATETVTYTYDALGRLVVGSSTGTVNNGQARSYCYDAAGNRTQIRIDAAGNTAPCATSTGSPTPSPTPAPTAGFVVVPISGYTLIHYQQ